MLKLRNFVAVALVLGVAAGIWLGDLWKGLGGGNGLGLGKSGAAVSVSNSGDGATTTVSHVKDSAGPARSGETLRVVIRDRSYFLKDGGEELQIALDDLVRAVQNASGDDDGLRLRVYRADDARVTADVQLREALQQAKVPESATYWHESPTP